ncbi:MerR family transcriptional regulator [Tamilnaduibacter salinus]|uniref:MerR family transcriptional regulator n=1 Tax=Tamilnaduibacter salinus TaxID=1484056 RepID=A0A2A2I1V5_9GAMM|nr:MerR family transcriptional regulator [Tamilnaduibacter salinus]PAV25115.1 MerR family transcriptional regulator [Tamilnaduibacter salinus]
MRIGELESRSGLSRHTIRYYEKEGLLSPPYRQSNNYRVYPESAVKDLLMIRELKAMDFTLAEIRSVLAAMRSGDMDCALGAALVRNKRRAVEQRMTALGQLLETLRTEEDRLRASAEALGKTVPEET